MFDKLKNLFESNTEREFKPREQGRKNNKPEVPKVEQVESPKQVTNPDNGHKSDIKSTSINEDPFKGKLESGQRIQSKIQLIHKLQKELKKYE